MNAQQIIDLLIDKKDFDSEEEDDLELSYNNEEKQFLSKLVEGELEELEQEDDQTNNLPAPPQLESQLIA